MKKAKNIKTPTDIKVNNMTFEKILMAELCQQDFLERYEELISKTSSEGCGMGDPYAREV